MDTAIENMNPIAAVLARLPLPGHVKALPLALHQSLRTAAMLEVRIIAVERDHAVRCAGIAADVLDRKGPDGKPLASNDTARKALIEQETAADEDCRRLLVHLDELKRDRATALADAEALRISSRLLAASSGEPGR